MCDVPPVTIDMLSRRARTRLDAAVDLHRWFVADKVHRTYLLHGPRGTGKTSFEVLFAREFGGRALMLDASALPLFSVRDVDFLIRTLRPRFLVIDDIDLAPIDTVAHRLLFMLQRMKTSAPDTCIMLSVNDASKLPSALLRCGRIDIPIRFEPPEADETEQMVRAALAQHNVPDERRTDDVVARIIAGSTDLTHAYVADLCMRLRREPVEQVIASVRELNDLAESAEAKSKDDNNGKPTSPPTKC